jgi:very-short-patch-repair endonuclease
LSFFLVLRGVVKDRAVVCVKVGLGDLFYVTDKDNKTAHRNRIDRKHVDFLLCDPATMRPLAGVELDDASHGRKDRQARDLLVEEVFAAAGLPLLREPARRAYDPAKIAALVEPVLSDQNAANATMLVKPTRQAPLSPAKSNPLCPKCGATLVVRKATKGAHAGKEFWACPNFPDCRHLQDIEQR